MAFGLSTPIVNRTRSLLARRSPASTILELLDAAVACSRAAKRPLKAAVFDDYVIRIGERDSMQWVLAPWNVPVEIAAELAFSCALDCLAFIQNLDFQNESTLRDAEKHLRGVLNAASLLHSLVLTVPSAAYVRRLFGQDLSRAAIAQSLTRQSLYAFLFRLAQREGVASKGQKLEWTDEQVIDALLKLTGAALAQADRAGQQPGIAEDLVGEFLALFGDREASCAHDPAFWSRAVERCEAMKFQNVTAIMALLRRAAAVQPESALARAAKALCSDASPNGEPAIVLLSFLQELRNAVAERMNSRYHPTQSPSTAEQRWKEQSVLVLRELYDALPSFLRRRAFQERLFRIANLNSDVIDPQWNVMFYEAHETIKAYIAQQRATGKRGREEVIEPKQKRGRTGPKKEIER